MTAADPEDHAAGLPREANHEAVSVPKRRSTWRPASEGAERDYLGRLAHAAGELLPDAQLVEVIERGPRGERISEGYLVRREGDEVQIVTRGEHWLPTAGAVIRDAVTKRTLDAPPVLAPASLREQVVATLLAELGWEWEEDKVRNLLGEEHVYIPSPEEVAGEIADALAPAFHAERRRIAHDVLERVIGMQVQLMTDDGVVIGSIDPNDVAEYQARKGLQW